MKERKTKIRLFIDYEKEENWVNKMSQSGWHLISFGFGYFTFEKGEPGKYIYRNEMVSGIGMKDESKEYIEFLKQSGVELVKKYFNWAYFRKNASEGPFELYSDTSSKLSYLTRIFYLFLFLAILNIFFTITNLIEFFSGTNYLHWIGFFNLAITIIISIPLLKVYRRRARLKNNLDIFND